MPGRKGFLGYSALEIRSGDRSESSDATWWSVASGALGAVYPVVSRLYLHWADNRLVYTTMNLEDDFANSHLFARRWIDTCFNSHSYKLAPLTFRLPSRLIDIHSLLSMPRLYLIPVGSDANIAYAALSYCWSITPTVTLINATLQIYIDCGFPGASLPQTVLDAITITRNLGLRRCSVHHARLR